MLGSSNGLFAEFNWIQFIVYCGLTAGLLAVGVYLILAIRDWMATPDDYETVGDDLESLRKALKFGSIDEVEYRKAVLAVQMQAERLNHRPVEPLNATTLIEALNRSDRPVFKETAAMQSEQDTAVQLGQGDQITETELSRLAPPTSDRG
jgi:hypothetical protein